MEVSEAIRIRRSVREYDPRAVPRDIIDSILEAGRVSPSANNRQPWHFIVVTEPEKRIVLSEGRWAKFLSQSPVVIVGCADLKTSAKWAVVDTTIALTQMVLAATSEGLGTCWIGSFYEDKVKDLLEIPSGYQVVAMLAVGYPRKKSLVELADRPRNRKRAEDIVSHEGFGKG